MRLSKRLLMNVSLVPEGAHVADIGCDHGYASIWLASEGNAEKVIAMDVNKGPIERAREHVRQAGLEDFIACRQSDGTGKLVPGEVDTLMIAGMGGLLMIRILEEGRAVLEHVECLVLQPQSDIDAVRRYVLGEGFSLTEEKACVEDGKYYFAMRAERCPADRQTTWEEEWQYRYGTYLVQKKDSVLLQYLNKERKKYDEILRKFDSGQEENERRRGLLHKINEIDKCLAQMMSGPDCQ